MATANKKIRPTIKRTLYTLGIGVCFGIISIIYQSFYSPGTTNLGDNIVFIGISLILVIIYRVILKPYREKDSDKPRTTIVTTTTTTITGTPVAETTSDTIKKIESG